MFDDKGHGVPSYLNEKNKMVTVGDMVTTTPSLRCQVPNDWTDLAP